MASDDYLSWSDGVVVLGDLTLPGFLKSHRIASGVRFDRAYRDHQSGKDKTPLGWEDADIKLVLDLTCDEVGTCYQKLSVIDKAFKSGGKNKSPRVYGVSGSHLAARGVSRVVFSGLESEETDQDDTIQVTLSFSEHIPKVVKREKQAAAKPASGAPATKAAAAGSPQVQQDTTNPFLAGFKSGVK